MISMVAKRQWLPFTLIILLAIVLRLINLGGRALWYDEAFAVLFAEKGLSAMLYGTLTPVAGGAADIHPLLYYSTLNTWMRFLGESPFTVRLLSVVFGVATVALIYLLATALFDKRTGLVAAFIAAAAPFHVQYSQETRMYALLGLILMAATWCFLKAWRVAESDSTKPPFIQRWRFWVAFGVLAGLAMYTQQLAAFYLVAIGLLPFVTRKREQMIGVVVGAVTAVIVYLPWLVNLPGQLQKVSSYYWLDKPGIGSILLTIRSFLSVSIDLSSQASLIAIIGALFITVLLVIQTIMFMRQPRTKAKRKPVMFVLWLAAAPPALMWLVSQIQPIFLERSLLPSALMLYVALAWLFTRSGMPRPIVAIVAGIGIVMVGMGLYYQYTLATFPNSPFQSAGSYIAENWQEGDVIVHQNKLTALPGIYYQRNLPQYFIGDIAGSSDDTLALPTQNALNIAADACVQSAVHDGKRIWWVVFDFAKDQYAAAGRPELEQAVAWLDSHYSADSTEQFNDLNVVLYSDPRGDLSTECKLS